MQVIHTEDRPAIFYTLNFERGEEVMSNLLAFLKKRSIRAAHIVGLGAASKLELAYYNLETKEYEKKSFEEDVEILSLVGNVGLKDGDTIVHLHGTFGRRDLSTFGGHIISLTISGAGELQIAAFTGSINRAYDAETGLNLMCPPA